MKIAIKKITLLSLLLVIGASPVFSGLPYEISSSQHEGKLCRKVVFYRPGSADFGETIWKKQNGSDFYSTDSGRNWNKITQITQKPVFKKDAESCLVYRSDDGGRNWIIELLPGNNSAGIEAFPNPASDFIVLKIPGNISRVNNISIFSETGGMALFKSGTNNIRERINIGGLQSGVYYIIVHTSDGKSLKSQFVKLSN